MVRDAPVAIIWSTPNSAKSIVVQYRVSLHAQLVCSEYVGHVVQIEELLYNGGPKCISSAPANQLCVPPCHPPWTYSKIILFGIRVRPYQICHWTLVRNLPESIDDLDLIDMVNGGAETAVDAEYGVVYHDTESQEVEHVGESLPYRRRTVLAGAFEVKAVSLRRSSQYPPSMGYVFMRASDIRSLRPAHARKVPLYEGPSTTNMGGRLSSATASKASFAIVITHRTKGRTLT